MGFGMGFGMIGLLLMLFFWGALILGGIWLVRMIFVSSQSNQSGNMTSKQASAREILDQRYARGEISREEYEQGAFHMYNIHFGARGGIVVGLFFGYMEDSYLPHGREEIAKYLSPARLFLNGVEVDKHKAYFSSGSGFGVEAYLGSKWGAGGGAVGWSPKLFPGTYQARIEFTNSEGELFTYEWEFTITEE